MKAHISALMDGELDERELVESLAALRQDGEAFEAWRTYHLIGDALCGRTRLVTSCGYAVAARLAAEPVLIGPLPGAVAAPVRPRWFVPSALAASVAAAALVGWMAFAPQQHPNPVPAPIAQAPRPVPALVAKAREVRRPLTAASRDYLLAHQAFSPRNSLQGVAAYIRSVSDDSTQDSP
ncbi:MAG: sigma-E factor negative regulatory protein [Burkholderiales bacterium]